jgi:hypothetical protein
MKSVMALVVAIVVCGCAHVPTMGLATYLINESNPQDQRLANAGMEKPVTFGTRFLNFLGGTIDTTVIIAAAKEGVDLIKGANDKHPATVTYNYYGDHYTVETQGDRNSTRFQSDDNIAGE